MMMKQEEIRKKAEELMTEIGHELLSDYEVTTGVAVRIVEWSNKKVIDDAYEWLKSHINDYLVKGRDIDYMFDDFRKAMEE
ncbi:MAG: hypothetical protein IJ640_07225 [Prevotella sp.]|nr:hypothetical protein [Prevotella sp.]